MEIKVTLKRIAGFPYDEKPSIEQQKEIIDEWLEFFLTKEQERNCHCTLELEID